MGKHGPARMNRSYRSRGTNRARGPPNAGRVTYPPCEPRHAGHVTEDVQLTPTIVIPASELSWQFSRSSGPGGQGVNTADSRVELRFDLARTQAIPDHLRSRALVRLEHRLVDGVLVVTASEHRSQLANRRAAVARLTRLLTDGIAPPTRPRRPTKPSQRSVQARLEAKRRRGDVKRLRRKPPDA